MKKYLLRNRHTLLAGVIAAFIALVLLEAGLAGRSLFDIEIDNSFLHIKIGDLPGLNDLEILEDVDIEL